MTSRRRLVLPAFAVAAGLALAGCGSTEATLEAGSSATTTPPVGSEAEPGSGAGALEGDRNDADVAFVTGMVPHHRQAITLADQALTKSANTDIKRMATAMKQTQAAELETMDGWLQGWGVSTTTADGAHSEGAHADSAHSESAHSEGAHTDSAQTDGAHSEDGAAHAEPGAAATTAGPGGQHGMLGDAELTQLSAAEGAAYDKLWLQLMIRHHEGAVTMAHEHITTGENPQVKELSEEIVTTQAAEISEMRNLATSLG